MATATKTRSTPARDAANAVTGTKSRGNARSGTQTVTVPTLVTMPSETALIQQQRFYRAIGDLYAQMILRQLEAGDCSVSQLAELFHLKAATLKPRLTELEAIGVIQAVAADRTAVYSFTKEGRARWKTHSPCVRWFESS